MNLALKFKAPRGKTLLGLTGPIASGKSLALALFAKEGAFTVSTDAVTGLLLTTPGIYHTISHKFGSDILQNNGLLDKKRLAAEVFNSAAKRKWLERLLHPEILKLAYAQITKSPEKIAVVEAPLLFEAGLAECFTLNICLAAPAGTLEKRALGRGWTRAEYKARLAAQLPAEEKYARADLVLENNGTPRELAQKIKLICRFLKETV